MSAERDDLRPPRGYSWPTATAGNVIALKHGAWSERKVAPLAARLLAEVVEATPSATVSNAAAANAARATPARVTRWNERRRGGTMRTEGAPR
jgi:hypothetical protein